MTGKKENITIRLLPETVDPSISAEVVCLKNRAVEASQFCTDWRNRRIAHRDFAVVMGESSKPLEQTKSRESLRGLEIYRSRTQRRRSTLSEFRDSLHSFSSLRWRRAACWYILDDGLKMDQQRRERLSKGEYTPEDFESREL